MVYYRITRSVHKIQSRSNIMEIPVCAFDRIYFHFLQNPLKFLPRRLSEQHFPSIFFSFQEKQQLARSVTSKRNRARITANPSWQLHVNIIAIEIVFSSFNILVIEIVLIFYLVDNINTYPLLPDPELIQKYWRK